MMLKTFALSALNAGTDFAKIAIGSNGGAAVSLVPLTGSIRGVSSNNLLADFTASIAAVEFSPPEFSSPTNSFSFSVNATEVPTPALFPGLVGIGVATLRKRKAEASSSVDA